MYLYAQNSDPVIRDEKLFDKKRPLAKELTVKVLDGFTLATVGDCIISRPLIQYAERNNEFARLLRILQESDALYGNLETTIFDIREFKGYPFSWVGDWVLVAEPGVAKDLALMGFDLFSRANNHAVDWGLEGMRETSKWLDTSGIVHAGAGENEGLARIARYFESRKGRVGLVSMASSFRPTSDALPARDSSPARPGISALNVKSITTVPADVMNTLVELRQKLYPKEEPPNASKGLSIFGTEFQIGKTFGFRHEMNQQDLVGILKSIRQGKQHSDLLVASIHSHESATVGWPETPASFLPDLAHAAIDAGADAFVTTGHHHLGPIEIYKDRPIFYGLGNFFWSDIQEPLSADLYRLNRKKLEEAFRFPDKATDADLGALLNAGAFANELTFQSVIAVSRFDQGKLSEILLYPVDLGYGRVLTESGIPEIASPEIGKKILTRLQEISAPYGTTILIENNTGIIRPRNTD